MSKTKEIELKLDILNENTDTYVSVTDLYGVNIFTNEDMDVFKRREEEEQAYYKNMEQTIFSNNTFKKKETVQSTLFTEEMTISKKQYVVDRETDTNVSYILMGAMVFIVFVLAIIQYNIYRAVRRKKDADKNNIYWDTKQN